LRKLWRRTCICSGFVLIFFADHQDEVYIRRRYCCCHVCSGTASVVSVCKEHLLTCFILLQLFSLVLWHSFWVFFRFILLIVFFLFIFIVPPPTLVSGEHYVFGSSLHSLLAHVSRNTIFFTQWTDFSVTWYKYS